MHRILAGLALALLVAVPVTAAPPNTIGIAETAPTFGDTITVVYTSNNAEPWAHLFCLGNGTTIGQTTGVVQESWARLPSGTFTLGPTPSWSSGGADCTVFLERISNGRFHRLAETLFVVAP